jgi:hypothetical protein
MRYEGYNGQITVDDATLTLARDGMAARATFGSGAPAWAVPLNGVASVEFEDATMLRNGWLRILVPGSTPGAVSKSNAASAGDTVLFTRKQAPVFAQVRDWLITLAHANHGRAATDGWPPVPAAPMARARAAADEAALTPSRPADAPAGEPDARLSLRPSRSTPQTTILLRGRGWGGQSVVGESHYEKALRKLAGHGTGERDIIATLQPDPGNRYDPNAVKVLIDGEQVGFLPKEDAPDYGPLLSEVARRGGTAAAAGRLWWSADPDWFNASVSLDVHEPALALFINEIGEQTPRIVLPAGSNYQVTGESEHLAHLAGVLARAYVPGKAAAYATLGVTTVSTSRTSTDVVAVFVDGGLAGTLSKQTSAKLLPLVAPMATRGIPVWCEATLTGNALAVEMTVSVTPVEQLPADLVAEVTRLSAD